MINKRASFPLNWERLLYSQGCPVVETKTNILNNTEQEEHILLSEEVVFSYCGGFFDSE